MINAGITGGDTLAAGELIRILINHPDVNIMTVVSDAHPGRPLTEIHRGLEGDTSLELSHDFTSKELQKLDVVFLCGEPWQAEKFMKQLPSELLEGEDPLRIIDLTGKYRDQQGKMVYGLPEDNRKALVRGATQASIPSSGAMAVELATFPFLKNSMLFDDIRVRLRMASTEHFSINSEAPGASAALSTRLDPVAPSQYRSDAESIEIEIMAWVHRLQPAYRGKIRISITRSSEVRGVEATVDVPIGMSIGDIERMFNETYEDHAFTYIIRHRPQMAEVENTNKCLIAITDPTTPDDLGTAGMDSMAMQSQSSRAIRIYSVIDNLLKGGAGNAVHCMNLLFGLQERTGLALKASAF